MIEVFYTDEFVLPLPPGHRFPMQKYRILRDKVMASNCSGTLSVPLAATAGQLALAHCPAYVARIEQGNVSADEQREIGFPWSTQMVERSLRSVGATVSASRSALQHGAAVNLAGGTHHAKHAKGGGFCVFNDLAVAARVMQAEWGRSRNPDGSRRSPLQVAVIDLDVHQGNGTASVFQGDDTVFTLSLHGEKNFPFRKEASDLDIGLPDGCTDDEYLSTLDHALQELEQRFSADFVFFLAGADPHEGDRLGRLKLTAAGLHARDQRVLDWCLDRRLPVVITMGGGYGHDLEQTVAVQMQTYTLAAAHAQRWAESTVYI